MIVEAAQTVQAVAPAVSQINPGLYIAIGAVVGALIGSGATIYWQWILRKEKYNEIIFKEKVEAYKLLNESLSEMQFQFIVKKGVKDQELNASFDRFAKLYWKIVYIVSPEVIEAVGDVAGLVHGETINMEDAFKFFKKLKHACRKDLHLDPISKEIEKSFDPIKLQNILGKKDEK